MHTLIILIGLFSQLRPIGLEDMMKALNKVKATVDSKVRVIIFSFIR